MLFKKLFVSISLHSRYAVVVSTLAVVLTLFSSFAVGCSIRPVSPDALTANNNTVPAVPGSPPTSSPNPTEPTFGQVSENGAAVFATHCAGCHGAVGQGLVGPALIGPNNNLGKYGNAEVLLSFTSSEMPRSAPGSLQKQQYLEVTGFLLLRNNFVLADRTFDPAEFKAVRLPQGAPSTSTSNITVPTGARTFEEAAVNGAAVFATHCAVCHGVEGQGGIGPPLIGINVELSDYGTADVLLGFILSEMPQNAPGSLQMQQYLEVTALLLVRNNIVFPGNPFDPAKFNRINLPD